MGKAKRIVVSVTTDLSTDQRVQKTCESLSSTTYTIQLLGRKLPNSLPLTEQEYAQKRFTLPFTKGFAFYAIYNCRLFIYLLFKRADLLWANDLDTLPANYLASKIKGIPLIYDSHEYFTEVPELIHRPKVQAVWKKIEAFILPRLRFAFTVSEQIAMNYEQEYGLKMTLVRNFPKLKKQIIANAKPQIIYQGALNKGRGLEDLIKAMQFISDDIGLLLVGTGDEEEKLKAMVVKFKLEGKVQFLGRKKPEELLKHTADSALGISIEEEVSLNYKYALPNKVFDYLHAEIPILYSDLIEVKKLLKEYEVGEELISRDPKKLAEQIKGMLNSEKRDKWKQDAARAAKEYNWEKEEVKLLKVVSEAIK